MPAFLVGCSCKLELKGHLPAETRANRSMDQCRCNGQIHDGDCTIEHGWTMDIAKGLSILERTCYACIGHLDKKPSEQEGGENKRK